MLSTCFRHTLRSFCSWKFIASIYMLFLPRVSLYSFIYLNRAVNRWIYDFLDSVKSFKFFYFSRSAFNCFDLSACSVWILPFSSYLVLILTTHYSLSSLTSLIFALVISNTFFKSSMISSIALF